RRSSSLYTYAFSSALRTSRGRRGIIECSGKRPDIYIVTYLKIFNHEKEAVWRSSRCLYRLVPSRGSDSTTSNTEVGRVIISNAAITTSPEVNGQNQTSATLSCNLTNPTFPVKGHYWTNNGKIIDKSETNSDELYIEHEIKKVDYHSAGLYACVFLTEPQVNATIEVKVPPHVVAYKRSENANEKDKAVLTCMSQGYPLPTDWTWYKLKDDESVETAIVNGSDVKYEMKNTPNKTMLYVKDLDINSDMGMYQCQGTNQMGSDSDKIQLRVRSQLAALWPFLGIVAEVIILIAIIFIYEKRRKPDEINDGM
uniref:Basigin n=1 Tax=Cyprinus carpio TaxID=7962 RepID=A0A8C1V1I4_CYPCA